MARPKMAPGAHGKITVTRDGTQWKARVRYCEDAGGKPKQLHRWGPTKPKAEAALMAALRDAVGNATAGDLTMDTRVRVLADKWLAGIDSDTRKSPGTKRLYRKQVTNHLIPRVGALAIRELNVRRAENALQAIAAEAGAPTARTCRACLSGMYAFAARQGLPVNNPARDTTPISSKVGKARALTDLEREAITDALRASKRAIALDVPDLVEWMLGTAIRIGEACAVRYGANEDGEQLLDLDAGTVEINATVIRISQVCASCGHTGKKHPKRTGRACTEDGCSCPAWVEPVGPAGLMIQEWTKSSAGHRVLALPPHLVDMLRRRDGETRFAQPKTFPVLTVDGILEHRRGIRLAFPSPGGQLRDPNNTNGDIRAVLDAIGRDGDDLPPFRWVVPHTFRKTAITRLLEGGLPPHLVADVAGHGNPSMTLDKYAGRAVVSARAAEILTP